MDTAGTVRGCWGHRRPAVAAVASTAATAVPARTAGGSDVALGGAATKFSKAQQVRTRKTPLVGVTMLQQLASLKPALSVPEHCARLFAGSDAAMVIRFG